MTARKTCTSTGTKQVYSIIYRRHAAFKDIILRGEEEILKRVTTDMNEAKWRFLAVVKYRFFVVYEDPSNTDSEELKQLLPEKKICIPFYGICSRENDRYDYPPRVDNVRRYSICYG